MLVAVKENGVAIQANLEELFNEIGKTLPTLPSEIRIIFKMLVTKGIRRQQPEPFEVEKPAETGVEV